MKYRSLGKTNLKVSEAGFGCWAIGGNKFGNSYGVTNDKDSLDALSEAFNIGCNFFETSDAYGHGHSEELIGNFISNIKREDVVIATKVGKDFTSGRLRLNYEPEYIKRAVEASLKRLNTDYIDIYQLHSPALNILKRDDVFEMLHTLKTEGKVRYIGVSINEPEEALEAIKYNIDTIQFTYNIFEQDLAEDIFPIIEKENLGVITREPLLNGLLTGKYSESQYFSHDDIRHSWPVAYIILRIRSLDSLKVLLNKEINSLTKLALKFVLAEKRIGSAIIGCKNIEQAKENFSISNIINLTDAQLSKINDLYNNNFNM